MIRNTDDIDINKHVELLQNATGEQEDIERLRNYIHHELKKKLSSDQLDENAKNELFLLCVEKVSLLDAKRLKDIFDFGPDMNESTRKTAFNMISTDKTDLHYISTWHKCFPNAIVDKEVMKHLEQASESMKIVGLEKE